MPANVHALRRSVAALAFGVVRDVNAKAATDGAEALVERDHQLQVPISGKASAQLVSAQWQTFTVTFETSFPSDAQGHRNPDFANPHFTFGYEMQSAASVMLTVCIKSWTKNQNGDVTGAVIRVAALALGARRNVPFRGVLHLNFQGWGAPVDDSTGENVGV